MDETKKNNQEPRWGQESRDRKALFILQTLKFFLKEQGNEYGKWLDIGCGSGGIANTLSDHIGDMVGIDPEPWGRWEQFKKSKAQLNFHVGGYQDIQIKLGDRAFDVVLCNQVYEHVDNVDALLGSIYKALKNDGVCYFAGPNLLWPIEPHVFWPFVHWFPRSFAHGVMRFLGSKEWESLDASSWTYWRLKRHFKKAGFDVKNIIPERIEAALLTNGKHKVIPLVRFFYGVIRFLTPVTPGFVFLLKKQKND